MPNDNTKLYRRVERDGEQNVSHYAYSAALIAQPLWNECTKGVTFRYVDSVVGARHSIPASNVAAIFNQIGTNESDRFDSVNTYINDVEELFAACSDGDLHVSKRVFHLIAAALYLARAVCKCSDRPIDSLIASLEETGKAYDLATASREVGFSELVLRETAHRLKRPQ